MWRCSQCGAEVEDDFEVCWSCSTARSGASYEEFHAGIPSASAPAPIAAPEVAQIAVLQAIEDGIGAIARHRVLLLAFVLLVASRLADSFFATPGTPAVEGANPIALLLTLLRWQFVAGRSMHLVVDALADGFVVAFLYSAACGRASPVEAASRAVSRLPSLVGAEAIVLAIFVAPFVALLAVGSLAPPYAALVWCIFALQIYLPVRLVFWREVIVVEAAGLARASRRSWHLVRRNWWRLAFLAVVTWWGGMRLARLPAYLSVPAGALLWLAADAVMASAYLQRVGLLPRRRPTLTQLVSARAAARAGVLDST